MWEEGELHCVPGVDSLFQDSGVVLFQVGLVGWPRGTHCSELPGMEWQERQVGEQCRVKMTLGQRLGVGVGVGVKQVLMSGH